MKLDENEQKPKYNIDYVKIKPAPQKEQPDMSKLKLDNKDTKTAQKNNKEIKKDIAKEQPKKVVKEQQQKSTRLKQTIKENAKKMHQAYDKKTDEIKQKIKEQKKYVAKEEKETNKQKKDDSLQSFLSTPVDGEIYDDLTRSYLALYGEDYKKFTKVQKAYLKEHLRDIGRITQMYLYYPEVAAKTRQSGMNIVEFYLHPNGDITELKLIQTAGYELLDKNSIQTIEVAYKDYPKPKEKTLIRIYINYRLY